MGTSYEKKMPDPQHIDVIDFFCGCGGMSWGFKATRQSHLAFEILAGVDINEYALQTYSENVGAKALALDVFSIADNPEILKEHIPELEKQRTRKMLFIGCAPCQGFSAHRKKDKRDDTRNNLMLAFAKICGFYAPDFIVMENVPEIFTGRFAQHYNRAEKELEGEGYHLNSGILDLSLFGVPQRRRRALVTASKKSIIPLPEPIFSVDQALTVRDAISHLNEIKSGGIDEIDPMHQSPNHIPRILDKIKKIPIDGGDRRALPPEHQLDCHNSVDDGDSPGFTDVYGRLRWDTPSVTITAKSSTPSCGRFLHPEQHRNISVREAAILQGFPQSYTFKGPFTQRYRQVGEAVPPSFARFVAKRLLDHIRPPKASLWPALERSITSNPSRDVKEAPLVVDAFCGAGGISLGFEWAGFDTAYAFDTDQDSINTFRKNISDSAEVCDVTSESVRDNIRNAVTDSQYVLVGGPPCQGFSQQRRGEHTDPRNNLVLAFGNLVKDLSNNPPSAVILENVTYLDSPRGRDILGKFTTQLADEGYTIQRHDFNSADYGVPQLRNRIVLVAIRKELGGQVNQIKPLTKDVWPTLGDAMRGLPTTDDVKKISNHIPSSEGALNRRRISFVDMGCGRLSIPHELQLPCHLRYNGHLDVYGRLDWFSQARTITGGFDSFTRGEFGHPFYHRSITHREAARVQGFPDYFSFEGNKSAVRKQIGNAVPPSLAYAIGKAVREWLATVNFDVATKEQARSA